MDKAKSGKVGNCNQLQFYWKAGIRRGDLRKPWNEHFMVYTMTIQMSELQTICAVLIVQIG